ncbi:MAG: hypothetical protein ACKOAH_10430, partial [Pirellula sp.]
WPALGHADSSNNLFGQSVSLDLIGNALFVSLEDSDSLRRFHRFSIAIDRYAISYSMHFL